MALNNTIIKIIRILQIHTRIFYTEAKSRFGILCIANLGADLCEALRRRATR